MGLHEAVHRLNVRLGAARGPDQSLREHLTVLATSRGGILRYLSADLLDLLTRVEAVEARLDALESERSGTP